MEKPKENTYGREVKSVCGLRLGEYSYAVSLQDTQEILISSSITSVPQSEEWVRGLINLRGQIITALDLRPIFGMGPLEKSELSHIIINRDGHIFSLIVDEIIDIITVKTDIFAQTPQTIAPEIRKYIKGVYKRSPNLLIEIDVKEISKLTGKSDDDAYL